MNEMLFPLKFLTIMLLVEGVARGAAPAPSPADQRRYDAAIALFRGGKYMASQFEFGHLAKAYPQSAEYWFNLASAYYMMGELKNALLCYEQVEILRSPLAPAARLYRVRAYRKQAELRGHPHEDLGRAAKALAPLHNAKLRAALATVRDAEREILRLEYLQRSMNEFEERDFHAALAEAQLSSKVIPNAEASLATALSLIELDRHREAVAALEEAEVLAPEREVGQRATQLLAQLREERPTYQGTGWLAAGLAGGYTSNIYATGVAVERSPVMDVDIDAGYRYLHTESFAGRMVYSFNMEHIANVRAMRFFNQALTLPLSFQTPTWLFEAAPRYGFQIFESNSFMSRPAVQARVQKTYERHDFGASYDWEQNYSVSQRYGELRGLVQTARLYWTYRLTKAALETSAVNIFNRQGDLANAGTVIPFANDARGPVLRLRWWPSRTTEFEGRASYFFIHYLNRSEPDAYARNDRLLDVYLKFSYWLSDTFRVYLSGQWANNDSTLGANTFSNKNYHQFQILGGFTFEVF